MSEDASGSEFRSPVIDVHAHLLPPSLLTPDALPDLDLTTLPEPPMSLLDTERRLREMDAAGVDRQVVSPWIELAPDGLEPRAAVEHVRRVNDALAVEVGRHPNRLVGMAMLPQCGGDQAARELDRAVRELGMCGALLTTSGVGLSLADPGMEPLWTVAERLNGLLMPHPRRPVEAERTRHEYIGDLAGTPLEGTLAVLGLLRSGVLDRHPALRMCVVHGGGALPVLAGRIEALWALSGAAGGAPPAALLSRLYFDTLTHDDRALAFLAEVVGPDRLLLGTDYPFATGDPSAAERVIRWAGADLATRDGVLGGTLSDLLSEVRPGA